MMHCGVYDGLRPPQTSKRCCGNIVLLNAFLFVCNCNICCPSKKFLKNIRNIFAYRKEFLLLQQLLREWANGETFREMMPLLSVGSFSF